MGVLGFIEGNLLPNPSFENGWYHLYGKPEYQIPHGWTVEAHVGGDFNFVEPEIRTLPVSQLPDHEKELFVRDGGYTLKAFKGGGATSYTFETVDAIELEAGFYRFAVPIYADIVWKYENGEKVYPDDPESCKISLSAGINQTTPSTPDFGEWNLFEMVLEVKETTWLKFGFTIDCIFPMNNNGIFCDALVLEKVEIDERRYSRTIHLMPQSYTIGQVAVVLNNAIPQKQSTTFSVDDAFIDHENLLSRTVVVWDVEQIAGSKQELEDWVVENYPPLPNIEYRSIEDEV